MGATTGRLIMAILLGLSLGACATQPMKKDPQYLALLEAYRQKNADLAERRQQRLEQGIKALAVTAGKAGPVVSVDLDQAPLPLVVRRLFDAAGVQYVFDNVVLEGNVTARFVSLPMLRALNLLLGGQGFSADLQGGVYVVRPGRAPDDDEPDQQPPQKEGAGAKAPVRKEATATVALKHLDMDTAAIILDGLYPSQVLRYGQQPFTSNVYLSGRPDDVASAADVLRKADRDPSHIVIEALVVEFDALELERVSFDLFNASHRTISGLSASFGSVTDRALAFTYTAGAAGVQTFTALIDILFQTQRARVISRPHLATLSGRKATMNITSDRHIITNTTVGGVTQATTQPVTSGVVLAITPTALSDGTVRMSVEVEDSQFTPSLDNVAIAVNRSRATTTAQVESGQSVIIGGLTLNRESAINAGAPWLRHIPGAQLLFANQQIDWLRSEVMIFLTPHLWSPNLTPPLVAPEALKFKETTLPLTIHERLGLDP